MTNPIGERTPFFVREVFSDQLVAHLAKPPFLYPVLVQGPIFVELVAWLYLVRFQD